MEKLVISHSPEMLNIDALDSFLDCAQNLDFEQGIPFKAEIGKGYDARICAMESLSEVIRQIRLLPAL